MTLEEIKSLSKNAKTVKISKLPNGAGNYSTQFYGKDRWIICSFKTYDDAVSFYYFEGFTKEQHLQKSLILERE